MRYPQPRYNTHWIALYLHQSGGATKLQCAEAMPQYTLQRVRQSIDYMLNQGMLDEFRSVYTVKPYLAKWFDLNDQDRPQEALQIVPPRVVNVYASPGLSAKYLISPLGMREGSNDHLAWKSKHA